MKEIMQIYTDKGMEPELDVYLDSIYLTPISDVKWMDNEQEDNWLEQCLGSISKNKGHNKNLWS